MKDVRRVLLTQLIGCLPLIGGLLVVVLNTTIAIRLVTPEEYLILFLAAVFGYVLVYKSRRVRHYYRSLAAHDAIYRYIPEAAMFGRDEDMPVTGGC